MVLLHAALRCSSTHSPAAGLPSKTCSCVHVFIAQRCISIFHISFYGVCSPLDPKLILQQGFNFISKSHCERIFSSPNDFLPIMLQHVTGLLHNYTLYITPPYTSLLTLLIFFQVSSDHIGSFRFFCLTCPYIYRLSASLFSLLRVKLSSFVPFLYLQRHTKALQNVSHAEQKSRRRHRRQWRKFVARD